MSMWVLVLQTTDCGQHQPVVLMATEGNTSLKDALLDENMPI